MRGVQSQQLRVFALLYYWRQLLERATSQWQLRVLCLQDVLIKQLKRVPCKANEERQAILGTEAC